MKIVKEVIEQIHSAVDNYQKTGVMPRASDMDHWADRLKEVFVATETMGPELEVKEITTKQSGKSGELLPCPICGSAAVSRAHDEVECSNVPAACPMANEIMYEDTWQALLRPSDAARGIADRMRQWAECAPGVRASAFGFADEVEAIADQPAECERCKSLQTEVGHWRCVARALESSAQSAQPAPGLSEVWVTARCAGDAVSVFANAADATENHSEMLKTGRYPLCKVLLPVHGAPISAPSARTPGDNPAQDSTAQDRERTRIEVADRGIVQYFRDSAQDKQTKGHDWKPSFFGTEYQTYKCSKCGSMRRIRGEEIGYCLGHQTLFTKWDEPEPDCL